MTSASLLLPVATYWAAVTIAYMKPAQAACTSSAGASRSSAFWTRQAVDGNEKSGVNVPTTTKSMSAGLTRALRIALRAASMHRSLVAWSGRAWRRDSIPVRCVIQSASNPNRCANSALLTTTSGTYDPQETTCTPNSVCVRRLLRRPPAAAARWGASRAGAAGFVIACGTAVCGTAVCGTVVCGTVVCDTVVCAAAPGEMFSNDIESNSSGSRLTTSVVR